jgi:hypothetical protein
MKKASLKNGAFFLRISEIILQLMLTNHAFYRVCGSKQVILKTGRL